MKSSDLNIFPLQDQPPFCQNRLPDSYWYKWKQNQRSHNGKLCFFMVYYYYQWLLCYWGLIHAGYLSLLIFIFHLFAVFLDGWIRSRTWQCYFWMDSYLIRWDQSVPSICWWTLHFVAAQLSKTVGFFTDLSIYLVRKVPVSPIAPGLVGAAPWEAALTHWAENSGIGAEKTANPESKRGSNCRAMFFSHLLCHSQMLWIRAAQKKQGKRASLSFFLFFPFGQDWKC